MEAGARGEPGSEAKEKVWSVLSCGMVSMSTYMWVDSGGREEWGGSVEGEEGRGEEEGRVYESERIKERRGKGRSGEGGEKVPDGKIAFWLCPGK